MADIDSTVFGRLGFDQALASAAERAASPLGREAILALTPSQDPEEVEDRCGRLAEVWALAEQQIAVPVSGLHDVREALERARPEGSLLEPEELQAVAGLAQLIDRMTSFLTENRETTPRLAREVDSLIPCPEVHREIDRCLTRSGDVADAASPILGRLRRDRRGFEQSIRSEIDRLMSDRGVTDLLQDSFHTERHGRHVLPLSANHRGRLPGIVHDRSATGETLFVEPMELVELTNDLTEARLAVDAEVARVLASLTSLVREHRGALETSLEALARLDAVAAVAEWGLSNSLHLPLRRSDEPLRLLACHHPLLWLHQREASVPLTLTLETGDRAVIISGPNAGGKTTALKTLGLVQMMTQAGLPVPADQASNVPVPRAVHADIGDDQDVMAGLSTFTAHMAHIARVCDSAAEDDLVLLDELGTATDPQEGGALAVAVLEALAQRGCLTIATSHLALLKQWAHETGGAQNASVGFDTDRGRPTYRLSLGLPGPSEALTVAGNVGLDAAILERARALVPEQEQRLGALITELRRENVELSSLREEAETLRARLAAEERAHRESAGRLEKERRAFRREIATERKRLLAEAKAEIESRIANLPSKHVLLTAKREVEADIRDADRVIAEGDEPAAPTEHEFAVGDAVEIIDARERGTIVDIGRGKTSARVETDRGMTITVKLNRLAPAPQAEKTQSESGVAFQRRDDISMELDLIGMRVEPALERLDKYLSDAVSHGLDQVRVIHGYGTGALRSAVRDFASAHELVKRWRAADHASGGHAVTVIELR